MRSDEIQGIEGKVPIQRRAQGENLYRNCPSCESKNVVIYERGEDDSYCLDCSFTWRQSENYITVSRQVLEEIVGLKEQKEPDTEAREAK